MLCIHVHYCTRWFIGEGLAGIVGDIVTIISWLAPNVQHHFFEAKIILNTFDEEGIQFCSYRLLLPSSNQYNYLFNENKLLINHSIQDTISETIMMNIMNNSHLIK